jgi:rhamnosyltransferase
MLRDETAPVAAMAGPIYNGCSLPNALFPWPAHARLGSRSPVHVTCWSVPLRASIIIRAKNEARDIGDTLQAIATQAGVAAYETIVVDSGSTDRTMEIAREFPVHLIQIPPECFTYGRALNLGIEVARGEFVIALSAHSLPASDHWLASMLEGFRDPNVAAVYGRHLPRANATKLELFGMRLSGVMSDRPRRQERDMMFSNANGAYRRHLALEHPFDESLAGAEDLAWADWAVRQGWAVYYEPRAAVYHSHGEPIGKLLRRMIHDQPTIWGLKLGIVARRYRMSAAPARSYRNEAERSG